MPPTATPRHPGYLRLSEAAARMDVDGSVLRRNVITGYLPATRVGGIWLVSEVVLEAFITLGRTEGRPTAYMQKRRRWVSDLMRVLARMVPPPANTDGSPLQAPRRKNNGAAVTRRGR